MKSPSHPDLDRDLIDGDLGEASPETETAEQPSTPALVPEGEDALVSHEATVPPRVFTWRSLTVLVVVVAAVRWWFSSNRTMFHMAADEPAQLAIARWLAGGTRWNMFDHSTWRPGMAVLLTPVFWFTDDTATIMRYGLLVTAVLGGLAAALCARLALRLTPMSPRACLLAAGVIALAPSSLSATAFIWAEGLVTLSFLGSLWYVVEFYDVRRTRAGVAAIVVAALGFTAHGRLLPMLAAVALLVVGRSLVARSWRQAGALATAAVAVTLVSFGFGMVVFDHVWDDPGSSNTVGTVVERLPNVGDNLRSAVGQAWYQLVSTVGLIGIGFWITTTTAFRRRPRDPADPDATEAQALDAQDVSRATTTAARPAPLVSARDARLVLAMVVPLVVVSMVFMSGRTRADHEIYGRYNDAVVWPLLVIAIAWLLRLRNGARPFRIAVGAVAVAVATVGSGLAVDRINHVTFSESVGVRAMISGLLPVIGTGGSIPTSTLTIAGLVGFAGVLVATLANRRGIVLALAGVAFVTIAGARTHEALNTRLNSWGVTTQVRDIEAIVPPGTALGVKFVPDADHPKVGWDDQRRRAQLYQFSLPDYPFQRDRGVDDAVGPYVFAPLGDARLEAAGATVIWRDPRLQYGLWVEPDPEPVEG